MGFPQLQYQQVKELTVHNIMVKCMFSSVGEGGSKKSKLSTKTHVVVAMNPSFHIFLKFKRVLLKMNTIRLEIIDENIKPI